MVYSVKLPPELIKKLIEIREQSKIPLAKQVREAVIQYCNSYNNPHREYQMNIKLLEIEETSKGWQLNTSIKVWKMMRQETMIDRECAWVLHLNGRLKLIEKELISMGTVDGGFMHPREVFKKAIINSSSSIIIVHNHPSGDSTPSEEDIKTSRGMKKAGELLRIPLLDFIIIARDRYTSFADEQIGGF